MELSAVILFTVFGITGVEPNIVSILGNLYYMNVSKTFYKEVPRYIDVEQNSSVTLYSINEGYKFVGEQFKEFEVVRGNHPSIKHTFVNKLGNTLECTADVAYFTIKLAKGPLKLTVFTAFDSPYQILCLVDDTSKKAFVISGKTKNATRGKLFAFDMEKAPVSNQQIVGSTGIAGIGDNITAIALRKGKLILTQEVAADKKAFNIIMLTPIKKEEEFNFVLKYFLEKTAEYLETNAQTRFSQTSNGNVKLREFLKVELKRIERHSIGLPIQGHIQKGSYNENLQAAIKETEVELLRLHKLNILGLDDKRYLILRNQTKRNGILHVSQIEQDEAACKQWMRWLTNNKDPKKDKVNSTYLCALTDKFEERRKLITASEKILVEISEWLYTQNDERWGLVGAVNILGEDHEINVPQAYDSEAPKLIQYDNIGNVIVFIKGKPYNIGTNFQYSWKPHPAPDVDPKIRLYFTDVFGNVLNCTGGKPTFWHKEYKKTYPILTGDSDFVLVCYGDYAKKRSFLIGSKTPHTNKGKLYVLDATEIDIDKGKVLTQEITEVGSNITAVTAHSITGVILLSEEVVISNRTSFNMMVLKQIPEEVITFEIDEYEHINEPVPKIYSTHELDENDFTNAIKEARDTIIDVHTKNWKSRAAQLIEEHDDLHELAEILHQYYQSINDSSSARNLSALLSETDLPLKDSFNDRLKADVKNIGNVVIRMYNKEAKLSDAVLNVGPLNKICIPEKDLRSYRYTGNGLYSCALTDEWIKNERLHEIVNEFYIDIMHYNNYYVDFPFEYGL